MPRGNTLGGMSASSSGDFIAPVTIQYSGKTNTNVKVTKTVVKTVQ